MSLSISGVGAVQPVYTPLQAPSPYAQSNDAAQSVADTTAGAETGAAAVVYEPGASDGESHVYSNLDWANRLPAHVTIGPASLAPAVNGDEAIVAASGGTLLPPKPVVETPLAAEVRNLTQNVWAPVGPIALDPASANVAASTAPVAAGQSEAAAQATYAAVVDASIAGASISELEKFA